MMNFPNGTHDGCAISFYCSKYSTAKVYKFIASCCNYIAVEICKQAVIVIPSKNIAMSIVMQAKRTR